MTEPIDHTPNCRLLTVPTSDAAIVVGVDLGRRPSETAILRACRGSGKSELVVLQIEHMADGFLAQLGLGDPDAVLEGRPKLEAFTI